RVEPGVDVAEPAASERRARWIAERSARCAHPEQRHVAQHALPPEDTDLAAGQHLSPGSADGEVDLPHVDARAGAGAVVMSAGGLYLGSKSEMHAQPRGALGALGIEHRKCRQVARANRRSLPPDAHERARSGDLTPCRLVLEDVEGAHIAGKGE